MYCGHLPRANVSNRELVRHAGVAYFPLTLRKKSRYDYNIRIRY